MSLRRLSVFASTLGVAACSALVSTDARVVRGTIVLTRAAGTGAQAVVGPYVSVIDSLALTITAGIGGTPQLIGRHLAPSDTVITIPLTVPAGGATLAVQVLSNNRMLLYTGQASTTIDRDRFAVTVPVVPVSPVLVVNPDTIKTSALALQTGLRFTKVAVHNSGNSALIWSLKSVDTAFTRCNLSFPGTIPPCVASPASGTVAPNGNDTLTFSFPDRLPSGAPFFAAHVFSFVLTSAQGDVTVRWRYP